MKKIISILAFTSALAAMSMSIGAIAQTAIPTPATPAMPDYDKPRMNLPAKLTIPEDANYVLFDGKKLNKEEAYFLEAINRYTINKKDFVLIRTDSGDKSCPSKFFFVVVDKDAAQKTAEFGTCSPSVQVVKMKNKITVDNAEFKPNNRTKYVFDGDTVEASLKK